MRVSVRGASTAAALMRAVPAAAEDREVLHVGVEAELLARLSTQRVGQLRVGLDDLVAVPADQVQVVVPVGGQVVGRARRARGGRG